MRVGLITWYGVTNYGSALQAYALQKLVARAGHDCVVLRHPTHEARRPARRAAGRVVRRGLSAMARGLDPRLRRSRANEEGKAQAVADSRASNPTVSERYIDQVPVDLPIIGSDQIFVVRARFHPLQFEGNTRYWCDKSYPAESPEQFVQLVSGATVVITNMFHGTCFSLRGGVPVIPIVMPHNSNKLGSLLTQFGVENHSVDDIEAIGAMDVPRMDFEQLVVRRSEARSRSVEYLGKALAEGAVGDRGSVCMC